MTSVVTVENLSKCYQINHNQNKQPNSIRELLGGGISSLLGRKKTLEDERSTEEFWALKNISFEIAEGERIAVIGSNGAGKSTLLKLLSRITEPTSGSINIKGKVASLLEVGTGFHPELTGRENIFLNGAILGMRKAEIKKKFDNIVQFSGVEKFLDTPVKHYSSGMYVRLAFSVSAWLDPDILIVDEVLSVGDQAFQKRCAERMQELTGDGRTVIFVSHSMAAVSKMCEKALYLERGEVVSYGPVEDVSTDYMRSVAEEESAYPWHKPSFEMSDPDVTVEAANDEYITCLGGSLRNASNNSIANIEINESFKASVKYNVHQKSPYKLIPNFHIYDEFGGRFFISFPEQDQVAPCEIGTHIVTCKFPPFLFNTGRYMIVPAISSYELESPVHFSIVDALRFEVSESPDSDSRRHGWQGALPGMSRIRLDWEYS